MHPKFIKALYLHKTKENEQKSNLNDIRWLGKIT